MSAVKSSPTTDTNKSSVLPNDPADVESSQTIGAKESPILNSDPADVEAFQTTGTDVAPISINAVPGIIEMTF